MIRNRAPKHVVQVLLLGVVVFALADDLHPERVVIEPQRLVGVADDDRGVIDPEEQPIGAMPSREPLVGGELQDFQEWRSGSRK